MLLNLLLLAAGLGVTGVVGWWRGPSSFRRSLGVSYLVGVAGFGIVAQLLYVCGASLARWQVVVICLVAACGSVRGLRAKEEPSGILPPTPAVWRFAAFAVCGMLALLAVDLWFQPLWAYDSWTFWTPKAHALWALGGLDVRWFTQADLISKDYPLLLPAVEAAGFRFTGYETALLDLQSLFFFAAFLRAIYEFSSGLARPVVLWAVLAMLVAAPSVVDQLAAAEADIPAAVLFATAGVCGACWLRDRRVSQLAVTALLAGGAAATKVEGFEFALGLFLVLAVFAARRSRRQFAEVAVAGAAVLVVSVLPWRVWLSIHHVQIQGSLSRATDLGFLIEHIGRLPLVIAYLAAKAVDPRAWLLILPLFVVILLVAHRARSDELVAYVVATILVAFLGLVVAYWSTPLGLHYQLATSARRVVTGIVFFAAAMTPLLEARR